MNIKPKEVEFLISYYKKLETLYKTKEEIDKRFLKEAETLVKNESVSKKSIDIVCEIYDVDTAPKLPKPKPKPTITYDPCGGYSGVRSGGC